MSVKMQIKYSTFITFSLVLLLQYSTQGTTSLVRDIGKRKINYELRQQPAYFLPEAQSIEYKYGQDEPYFDTSVERNVTTTVGDIAYLKCRIRNLNGRTVTWVRQRDLHILTVGKFTYTNDQRFISFHSNDDWTLQIRYPNKTDEGVYECQISTVPKMSFEIGLKVLVPKAKIMGGPSLYIKSGSTITLTCVVQNGLSAPKFVFWYHNDDVINYKSPRGGIVLDYNSKAMTKSILTIRNSKASDSGNYTCKPSNTEKGVTRVHILNGEHPAAMQENRVGSHSDRLHRDRQFIVTSILAFFELYYYSSLCSR